MQQTQGTAKKCNPNLDPNKSIFSKILSSPITQYKLM